MKFVIPGGTGQVGRVLERAFRGSGHEVVLIGRPMQSWASVIDGTDVVINHAGRTVNCRYTKAN